MIYCCCCTKSSSSPLENPKHPENLKSCKSCGGKLPVDGRGAQQGIMMSNLRLELSNVISPHLSWKTASNGRQRTSRRARTSFTWAERKNYHTKNLKATKDLTDKDSKSGYMLASESEKIGVSILGRCFSDTVGSVPIKKRRLLLVHSPSPPHRSSLYSDSGLEEQSASYQDALLTAKQHSHDLNSGCESELVQGSNFGLEKSDLEGVTEKICDAANFSGISVLAAAACDSSIGGEFMNGECSTSKLYFSEVQEVPKENAKLSTPHEKADPQPQTSEYLFGRIDLPFNDSSSLPLHSKESNEAKSDGSCNLETSVNLFQIVQNKTMSSSGNVKFHWDLNIAIEGWDSHEEVLSSDHEAVNNVSEVGDHNDKLGNVESYMDQVGFGDSTTDSQIVDSTTDSQIVDSRDHFVGGVQKVLWVSQVKTEVTLDITCDNLAADSKESKPIPHTRCLQAEEDVPLCADSGAVKSDNAHTNALDETNTDNADKSNKKDSEHGETTAVEVKMDNTKLNLPNDEIDAAKSDFPANIGSEISIYKSTGSTPVKPDASPALSSQDVCINNTGQFALKNHLECHYYSDASQNNDDQTNRMEKVELLGDDDSQYEDGELRGPLANCWIYDGAEEGENEQVDYGSDICEAASDFYSGNRRASDMGFSDASHDNKCREVRKETENSSQSSMNCHLLADILDSSSGKGNVGNVTGLNFQENLGAGATCNDFRDYRFVIGVKKMSGWDQLLDGYRSFNNGNFGSINQNQNGISSYPLRASGSLNRAVASTLRRDSSSRIERMQSSDVSQRNDKSYVRLARSNERNGFNPRVKRDRDFTRSKGTSGPLHFQGSGRHRCDQRVDSSYHHDISQHDSFGYFGPASFSHHGSRNGFVIASDDTFGISKVSSQNSDHPPMARRSPIERERAFCMPSRPGPSREMSPDRPMFVGQDKPGRGGGVIHREKYHGPLPNDITDSSSSMHHTMHRRDHNFSPHRRPLHVSRSHSRSPSRPRTISPHRWISHSGRRDNVMNGSPGSRQCNKSPNFKSEARINSSRAGFWEHVVCYTSLSRNRTSSPHASRWIDGRKEVPEHFGDYEDWQCPERSPPAKVFSRVRRFDLMDSPGRLEPDKYCYPMNSGRFHESAGFGRGSIHDGKCDNRRKHEDRCEMPHSAKHSVNDDKNGFMAQNLPTQVLGASPKRKLKGF